MGFSLKVRDPASFRPYLEEEIKTLAESGEVSGQIESDERELAEELTGQSWNAAGSG